MPHPKNPQIVYGACKGQFGRMFMNTRQEQNYWVGAQSLYGNDAKDLILRFQRVSPMETSLVRLERRVLRLAVRASLEGRRRALGKDLARSHGESAG